MDIKTITIIVMITFIVIVAIISIIVLVNTYKQRAVKANFKLPDLYATNKSYRSSKIPKKMPEVSDKEVEELINNTTANPSNINFKEIEDDLRRPRRKRIYLPNLNEEKKVKTHDYKPIEIKTEFDNLMDELNDEEILDD